MLADDTFTYSGQRAVSSWSAKQQERVLLTLERSQKLDLLIHLLTNLEQSLVVCGAPGIGKTTLLNTLDLAKKENWRICRVDASASSSFESILSQLGDFLRSQQPNAQHLALKDLLTSSAQQQKKIILIVEDAGDLVPGLIDTLNEFAVTTPGVRLVLSMTFDQFHTKANTDKSLEDCHVIEIPPLALRHYRDYLQNLSVQPDLALAFNAISDHFIEQLYEKTHGIPGKIQAELPKYAHGKATSSNLGLWLLFSTATFGIAAAIVYWLQAGSSVANEPLATSTTTIQLPVQSSPALPVIEPPPGTSSNIVVSTAETSPSEPESKVNTPSVKDETLAQSTTATNEHQAAAEQAQPVAITVASVQPTVVETKEAVHTNAQPAILPATISKPDNIVPKTTQQEPAVATPQQTPAPSAPVEPLKTAETKPVQTSQPDTIENKKVTESALTTDKPGKTEKPPAKTSSSNGEDDIDWIVDQPPGNFTLQVMVLSSKVSVQRFLKKYADYRSSLKYYVINKNGQEKFVLIYGTFATSAEAITHRSILPKEFQNALEKRFRAIQKEAQR